METLLQFDKIGGIGASEIGALFTKDGLKAKTAQSLAYEKALELITGNKRELTTIAMQHGIFNEEEAFNLVVKPNFPDAVYQSAESIFIKDSVWATPDVVDPVNEIVMDIKCPYTIYTYLQNQKKVPNYYVAQCQMQLLATRFSTAYLVFYLTSNVVDDYGNKIEFDIDINERHCFIEIPKDEDMMGEIILRTDGFFEIRDLIFNDLTAAEEISDKEYFAMAMSDHKVTRFKDKSNLLTWSGKIYKNEREGYLVIE